MAKKLWFVHKIWQNLPTKITSIDAAAIMNMEDRTAGWAEDITFPKASRMETYGHSYADGFSSSERGLAFDSQVYNAISVSRGHNFSLLGSRTQDNYVFDPITSKGAFGGRAIAMATTRARVKKPYLPIIDGALIFTGINEVNNTFDQTATIEALRYGIDLLIAASCIVWNGSGWAVNPISYNGGTAILVSANGPFVSAGTQQFVQTTDEGKATTFTVPADYDGGTVGFHHVLNPSESATVTVRRNGTIVDTFNAVGVTIAGGSTWRGAWSGATSYVIGDSVSSGGNYYCCVIGNTNQVPPGFFWQQIPVARICRRYTVVAGDTFTLTYSSIVGSIRFDSATLQAKVVPPVMLCNIAKPVAAWNGWGTGAWPTTTGRIDTWNASYASLAQSFGSPVTLVDVDTRLAADATKFDPDNLHPNDVGHREIAIEILNNWPRTPGDITLQRQHPPTYAYTPLFLFNGFTNTGSPYATMGFRTSPGGEVRLQGRVTNTNVIAGTGIAILPVYCRPASTVTFPVVVDHSGTLVTNAVSVSSDGQVKLVYADATTNFQVSLNGIAFAAER